MAGRKGRRSHSLEVREWVGKVKVGYQEAEAEAEAEEAEERQKKKEGEIEMADVI